MGWVTCTCSWGPGNRRRLLSSSVVSGGGSAASPHSGHSRGKPLSATQNLNFWSLLWCPPLQGAPDHFFPAEGAGGTHRSRTQGSLLRREGPPQVCGS